MTKPEPVPARTAGTSSTSGRVGLWRAASWREALYALINFPLAIAFFVTIVVLIATGAGLTVIYIGIALGMAGLGTARLAAATYRGLGRGLLDVPLDDPAPRERTRPGIAGAVRHTYSDTVAWRAVGYVAVKIVLAPLTFAVAVALYSGIGPITYPIWRPFLPRQLGSDGLWHSGTQLWNGYFVDTWPSMAAYAAVGAAMLLAAPYAVHGMLAADRALMKRLLGPPGVGEVRGGAAAGECT